MTHVAIPNRAHRNRGAAVSGGADTNSLVNEAKVARAQQALGQMPRFWARYFKTPGSASNEQYQAGKEGAVLRKHSIGILPLARQTNRVGKGAREGAADARKNAAALFNAFGKEYIESRGAKLLVALDIEQDSPMSSDYYTGWSNALTDPTGGSSALAPAIYSSTSATQTWKALARAISNGAVCQGAWIARYLIKTGCVPVPGWREKFVKPKDLPAQCPLLAWQYAQECEGIDYSLINPDHEADFLAGIIVPPEQAIDIESHPERRDQQGSMEHLHAALAHTISQLEAAAHSLRLPDGRPYLFPNGINAIDLTVDFGGEAAVRLNIGGS